MHGIPETLISDNGPQFVSQEFIQFARSYDLCHVTSSPQFPQSNGHAERAIQTVKNLLRKSEDPHLALLCYRSTPLPWCNITPTELLMGRKVRTNLPQAKEALIPNWPHLSGLKERDEEFKHKQKEHYDRRHQARPLSPIADNSEAWIMSESQPRTGRVIMQATTPRSYTVDCGNGEIRRNRYHLNPIPSPTPDNTSRDSTSPIPSPTPASPQETSTDQSTPPPSPRMIMTRSRTGTIIRPPDRLF